MSFAGKVWRLLVGIKDALALLFLLLFFTALFAILVSRPSPGAVREGALLLSLDGSVVEEVAAGQLKSIELLGVDVWRPMGMVLRRGRTITPALREFMKLLRGFGERSR